MDDDCGGLVEYYMCASCTELDRFDAMRLLIFILKAFAVLVVVWLLTKI